MDDKDLKLVTEIGKVIMNIIEVEGGVTLPSIGVIRAVEGSYELVDGGEEYPSLVDALEGMSGVSRRQAEALYGCWLDVVEMESGAYSIDMIGVVRDGELIVEHKLFSRLNDEERKREVRSISAVMEEIAKAEAEESDLQSDDKVVKEVKEKSRVASGDQKGAEVAVAPKRRGVLLFSIAALLLVGVAVYSYMVTNSGKSIEPKPVVVTEQVEIKVDTEPKTEVVQPVPVVEAKPEVVIETETETEERVVRELYLERGEEPRLRTYRGRTVSDDEALAVLEQTIQRSVEVAAKRYQVVLGAYAYGSNVGRLIVDFEQFNRESPVPVYVAVYGKSRVVSLFGSDSKQECERYISEIGSKLTANLWICKIK
ncbi:MAG: hypothetical protein SNG35_06015 [Rikenellaceae bacterium]